MARTRSGVGDGSATSLNRRGFLKVAAATLAAGSIGGLLAGCGQPATAPAKPAAEATKPAAKPTDAPAAKPTEAPKPAVAPTVVAQPAKPAEATAAPAADSSQAQKAAR